MYTVSTADMAGLTRRALTFLQAHAARVPGWTVDQHRQHWTQHGRPASAIDQLIAHQERWGGLVLPPAAHYDGGPHDLDADDPDLDEDGIVFTVGQPRYSTVYSYAVDSQGRFGICGSEGPWVPLHASVDGWVESLALTYAAQWSASVIRRVEGAEAEGMLAALDGQTPVPEVAGVADNWWRTVDSVVAAYCGEAIHFGGPTTPKVLVYEGPDLWRLWPRP